MMLELPTGTAGTYVHENSMNYSLTIRYIAVFSLALARCHNEEASPIDPG